MPSNPPTLPDYAGTTFYPHKRPGVMAALFHGHAHKAKLTPVADNPAWTQRDINEMMQRGWVKRSRQRGIDKAWWFELTTEGRNVAEELL